MTNKIPIIPPEEMETVEQRRKREEEIERKEREIERKKLEDAIEGWRFTDRAIKEMKRLNQKTKTVGIEYGSLLCGDIITKKIDLSGECTGTECKVELKRARCPKGKIELGTFHTHPDQKVPQFSPPDISYQGFYCLGVSDATEENKKLTCIVNKKESLEHERLDRRIYELELLQIKSLVEEKYLYVRDLEEIIEDDYHKFNPEKYTNPKRR